MIAHSTECPDKGASAARVSKFLLPVAAPIMAPFGFGNGRHPTTSSM
jgi:hypothetical protein